MLDFAQGGVPIIPPLDTQLCTSIMQRTIHLFKYMILKTIASLNNISSYFIKSNIKKIKLKDNNVCTSARTYRKVYY